MERADCRRFSELPAGIILLKKSINDPKTLDDCNCFVKYATNPPAIPVFTIL